MSDMMPLDGASALFQMRASHSDSRLSAAQQATSAQRISEDGELAHASEQFEAMLLTMMLKEMRNTVPESGLFPKSMAEDIFTSMLDEQYAESMARSGGIGLARMIMEQFQSNPLMQGQTQVKKDAQEAGTEPADGIKVRSANRR